MSYDVVRPEINKSFQKPRVTVPSLPWYLSQFLHGFLVLASLINDSKPRTSTQTIMVPTITVLLSVMYQALCYTFKEHHSTQITILGERPFYYCPSSLKTHVIQYLALIIKGFEGLFFIFYCKV